MKIAVVNLTSGGLSGGYRKYLRRLMPLMAGDPRVTDLQVFLPPGVTLELDASVAVRSWPGPAGLRGVASVAREVLAARPDVVFVPTARHADFAGLPVATMVRNMEPLTVPFGDNAWIEGLRNLARAWEARRACLRAARVIAVSEHVRDVIVGRWRLDPDRVGVVYHGVDPAPVVPKAGDHGATRTLFTAGSIRPARGLDDVIHALPLVGTDARLVVAGRVDRGCEGYVRRLRSLAVHLGVADRIAWAGELGESEMIRALSTSAAFVMTSRAEACPNIVLEAMSCGCASVSVDHAPMPEFFGGAARYYPAGQPAALAAQLRALLADASERDRLGNAARNRAAAFTWDRTRDRTIGELERTIG